MFGQPVKAQLAKWIADGARKAPRWLNEPLALVLAVLLLVGHGRRTALENLGRAFPAWSLWRRWRVAFSAYRQMARTLVEFLHTPSYADAEIRERVTLDNVEALEAARDKGRGVILLSGHYGNWEWLGRAVSAAGYPFAALYKEPKDAGFGTRLKAMREAAGLVQIDHDDMRAAIQWLRKGGVLGIIMDQEPRRSADGAIAPLFGHPAITHVGPFRLARLADVPLLTIFCHRVGSGRYRGELKPFQLSALTDSEQAVAEDAAVFNGRLEEAVRDRPDHWLWMYRRWGRIGREKPVPESDESSERETPDSPVWTASQRARLSGPS